MCRTITGLAPWLNANFAQNAFEQAPFGQGALQQVGTNEGRKGQKPLADKHGAAGNAQSQRQQNKNTGDQADTLPRGHKKLPFS
jgi:hypothetical protein